MALIKCPACGHKVSTSAPACPSCGVTVPTDAAIPWVPVKPKRTRLAILLAIASVMIIIALGWMCSMSWLGLGWFVDIFDELGQALKDIGKQMGNASQFGLQELEERLFEQLRWLLE